VVGFETEEKGGVKFMHKNAKACSTVVEQADAHRVSLVGTYYRRLADDSQATAIQIRKRGKWCTIGKLVVAHPLNERVFGTPYRNRQSVQCVSIPPFVLDYLRQLGVRSWVVRDDREGRCYILPLDQVKRIGWLRRSEGKPEWFVPLDKFEEIDWQDWPYVEKFVRLEDAPLEEVKQLCLNLEA